MTILTFVDYYLPGYKSGGPVRSVANLVERLGNDFHFVVVTTDRDCGDRYAYPGIRHGTTQQVGKAEVIYVSRSASPFPLVAHIVRQVRPSVLYLNSFFSRTFSIVPIVLRRLRLIPRSPVVLAPRGEFSLGAVNIKAKRKRAFLAASSVLRLHDDITWQASSAYEEDDIRRCIRGLDHDQTSKIVVAPIMVAPDLVETGPLSNLRGSARRKMRDSLRIVFLSRVTRKKNLVTALRVLQQVRGRVEFSICGPLEDTDYWKQCQQIIRTLPKNVTVHYRGAVDPADVPTVLAQHDLFFFPTLGENYGHVILEALMAGCPVLLSDQTPWRNLTEDGVGWDLRLDRPDCFREVLEQCIAMDGATFGGWSERAAAYGLRKASDPRAVEANRRLFRSVAGAELALA